VRWEPFRAYDAEYRQRPERREASRRYHRRHYLRRRLKAKRHKAAAELERVADALDAFVPPERRLSEGAS
jgi:hypothetical protein